MAIAINIFFKADSARTGPDSSHSAGTAAAFDGRSPARRLRDEYEVWACIAGLACLSLGWALIAWAAIGNTTLHRFHYAIPNPTPAAHDFNYAHRHSGD